MKFDKFTGDFEA